MQARSHGSTSTGRRERNEDAYCIEPELGLFAVADGMGGYEGGNVASRVVVDTMRDFFRRGYDGDTEPGCDSSKEDRSVAECRMKMAIRLAHREVVRRAKGELADMGSTIASLLIHEDRALVAHVGDSRVYLYRGKQLHRLTQDHSLVAELQAEAAGGLPAVIEAPLTHVITRAISKETPADPDVHAVDVRRGDRFLLCSDGLTDVLHDDVLANLLRDHPVDRAPDALVELAYAAGSRDNITAVVVEAA